MKYKDGTIQHLQVDQDATTVISTPQRGETSLNGQLKAELYSLLELVVLATVQEATPW
ncbi:hypothetical protein AC249_AIPGENE5038, partial [Exaiptasia diaphana]